MAILETTTVVVHDGPPSSGPGGTGSSRGAVGLLLLDIANRQLYVCVAAEPSSGTGAASSPAVPPSIQWEPLGGAA